MHSLTPAQSTQRIRDHERENINESPELTHGLTYDHLFFFEFFHAMGLSSRDHWLEQMRKQKNPSRFTPGGKGQEGGWNPLPFLAHPLAAKKLSFALIHYRFRRLKLTSFSISLFFFLFSRPANQQALTRPSIFWLTILSSTYSPLIFFRTLFLFPEMEDLRNQWGNGRKNNTGFTDSRPRWMKGLIFLSIWYLYA